MRILSRMALVASLLGIAPAAVVAQTAANRADVTFMQGMIGHHTQALTMSALVTDRSTRPAMKLLAERITVAQQDEIASMKRWLAARGQPAGDDHAMHGMTMPLMPGMLTAQQLTDLGAATGDAFDRLFLQLMIMHHEGAITMVKSLFASQGAGQDTDVFRMASEVDTDQRAEINRMRALLATLPAR